MTARRRTGGGMPVSCGARASADGDHRRNLHIGFERLSASPPPAPRLEPGRLPFKRSNLAQAAIDSLAVIYLPLFSSLIAAAFGVAFYIVIFVRPT